ncbi:hypothetical protein [Marinigracilibium pacificum]|uniref:Uncharacterized protein n=1 Tax=Marinigracilibium pacificum TaxID=2729599 RepID=A0A848J404_9BACT|nr:hypothetical protein [Marinigracilibium pacificum]NMM49214.1 hypothetical protein [Marinigracilibium pacificum]
MEIEKLNEAITEIVEKRAALSKLKQGDDRYNLVKSDLDHLESEFKESFYADMNEILYDVHDEFCPDNDVWSPIKYFAETYTIGEGGKYIAANDQGLKVQVDDFDGKECRLVILPNPARIELRIDGEPTIVAWHMNKSKMV